MRLVTLLEWTLYTLMCVFDARPYAQCNPLCMFLLLVSVADLQFSRSVMFAHINSIIQHIEENTNYSLWTLDRLDSRYTHNDGCVASLPNTYTCPCCLLLSPFNAHVQINLTTLLIFLKYVRCIYRHTRV